MLIGIRSALIAFVLVTFALTGGLVDLLWWHTAQSNSRMLANTLDQQIIGEVRRELASLIGSAEAAYGAIHTILVRNLIDVRDEDKREIVFLAQLQAQPALSWISFGWPDGSFFAVHKPSDDVLEMVDIPMGPTPRQRRVDTYRTSGSVSVQNRRFLPTAYDVTAQPWYRTATPARAWSLVTRHPGDGRPSVAYAGGIDVDGARRGVLAVMIDLDRLSRFLAGLAVGRTGAAFVLDQNGAPVAVPSPQSGGGRDPTSPALLGVARRTHDLMLAKADPQMMRISGARVPFDGIDYAVTVTPLDFMDWEVTTVIPETDFLGPIDAINLRVSLSLVVLVLAAVGASTLMARRLLVGPLTRIAEELGRVQRFELDGIHHHPARLRELDLLSHVIADMAAGLAAFRKYLPADLVGTLLAEGIEARPGGTVQAMTILFADIEGFTGLSERMGETAFPLLARYLDVLSTAIMTHGGTIDKFIGDGVMAFWGAPNANPDHASDACRAALACVRALELADIRDDGGKELVVRIGINSGDVLVGNVGTDLRLNYTVIGDAVNVASRLEGTNKVYGTSIVVGDATRRMIGAAFLTRLLDRVALRGRTEGVEIYELLGPAEPDTPIPDWVVLYESALAAHGARNYTAAAAQFADVIALRGQDSPSLAMIERCRSSAAMSSAAMSPGIGWHGSTLLDEHR